MRAWINPGVRLGALLLCACLALLDAPSAVAEARIALVIGNSNYGAPLGSLKNPANDARLITKSLEGVGFRVTTLLDADQREMKRAISDFGGAVSEAGSSAVALFFYAGHGIQVDGVNYLVPVGARIERKGDVDLEAIEAEALLKQLEYAGAGVSIVVLDACRNNPLPRSFRSGDRGLARMDAPTGSFVAYSTAPGDVAVDGEGNNSPFAAALAEEVRKPGASVEEVFRSVRRKVMGATGEQQVPWDSSSLTAPFYFQPAGQQTASAAPAQPAAAAPTATTGGSDQMLSAEMLMWESIKDSNRPGDFSAYLKRFPDGVYSDLALNRLAELGGASSSQASAALPEPAPEPEPMPEPIPEPAPETKVAALAPANSGAGSATDGRSWVVDPSFRGEIEKYFEKAKEKSRQVRALAIARDGSSIGIGLASPKVESGWASGGGNASDVSKTATDGALKKCGGKDRCQLAYVGDKKQGSFDLVFADGSRAMGVEETQPAAAAVASVEPDEGASAPALVGSTWVVSASLQGEIEKYMASAGKGGKQMRALAIAKDGSRIGVGLYTPKAESGWAGGGDVVSADAIVADLALKKCGGQAACKIAYIGVKKQGSFELTYQ